MEDPEFSDEVPGARARHYPNFDIVQVAARRVDNAEVAEGNPFLVDKFVDGAIEVDVDAISDGNTVVVGGIMEHIEEAGVHSGDSSCSLPPYTLSDSLIAEISEATHKMAKAFEKDAEIRDDINTYKCHRCVAPRAIGVTDL